MTRELSRRNLIKHSMTVAAAAGVSPAIAFGKSASLSFEEYRNYDALGLAGLVTKGEISALELLEIAIARTEAVNPSINCIVEKLYNRARIAAQGDLPEGPFCGVPFLLKDLGMALTGTVTTNGSRFYKGAISKHNSTVVDRYQQAGLIIFGKTASPEFGGTGTTESILFGDTHNPWDLTRTTGGSSGRRFSCNRNSPHRQRHRRWRVDSNPRVLLWIVWYEAQPWTGTGGTKKIILHYERHSRSVSQRSR
jgi:amidase